MKCIFCSLAPVNHFFKYCKQSDCSCNCIWNYLKEPNNTPEIIKDNSPKWLEVKDKESQGIKLPKEYKQYINDILHYSRGIRKAKNKPKVLGYHISQVPLKRQKVHSHLPLDYSERF